MMKDKEIIRPYSGDLLYEDHVRRKSKKMDDDSWKNFYENLGVALKEGNIDLALMEGSRNYYHKNFRVRKKPFPKTRQQKRLEK